MNHATSWEASLLDWNVTALDGRNVTHSDVVALLRADSDEGARNAYWRLDGTVCKNGVLSRAAVPVVQTLLALQPDWTEVAKSFCLELLGQICAADGTEEAPGAREECLAELRLSLWFLLHGLQFDPEDCVPFYVDLLGLLAFEYRELRPRVTMYLNAALQRPSQDVIRELIRNTVLDLVES